MSPKITVLMPVYNGEAFVGEAIDSILAQSLRDFELLVMDDGSSDRSGEIVLGYQDPRVRFVRNEKNLGLISTLNQGVVLASGDYIARMDCDDVSLPHRLEKQVEFLEKNPSFAMVAVKAAFIDAEGRACGFWNDDQNVVTYEQIVSRLPRANCIVHPGVMIRKAILEKYQYDKRQLHSEDYDLWLRLVSDGEKIGKIDETLLQYRLTSSSITAVTNTKHPDFKNVKTKSIFVWNQLKRGKVNYFVVRVFLNMFKDLYYWLGKIVYAVIFGRYSEGKG